MSNSSSEPTAPGWYRNPNGGVGKEWWNGSSWGMGEYVPAHVSTPALPAPPGPVAHAPGAPQGQSPAPAYSAEKTTPYASPPLAASHSASSADREPSPFTWQVWVIALLPLVPYVSGAFIDTMSLMLASSSTSPEAQLAALAHPAYITFFVSIWVMFIANFFLAYADGKKLERRGVPYPMPFGLIFFSSFVFIIGRTANVKRYLGTGLAPLWTTIAVQLVGVGVYVFIIARVVAQFPQMIQSVQGF